jgi:hypothetical protein
VALPFVAVGLPIVIDVGASRGVFGPVVVSRRVSLRLPPTEVVLPPLLLLVVNASPPMAIALPLPMLPPSTTLLPDNTLFSLFDVALPPSAPRLQARLPPVDSVSPPLLVLLEVELPPTAMLLPLAIELPLAT